MKYFSAQKISILLAFTLSASQVQGSNYVLDGPAPDLHQDLCLVRQFGASPDHATMASTINATPIKNIIDAFINCPNQMSYIYCDRLSIQGADELVKAIKNSGKIVDFYQALHSVQATLNLQATASIELAKREYSRQMIYIASYYHDIPGQHFLDLLKQIPFNYVTALFEKAMTCKTPESVAWITDLLKVEVSKIEEEAAAVGPNADMDSIVELIHSAVKMVNGDDVDVSSISPQSKLGLLFTALGFNRYDIAQEASRDVTLNINFAINFTICRTAKHIEDRARAVDFLKSLLPTEEEKMAFENFVNLVGFLN